MTTNIEALEELLESSEKIVRKREASEDRKNVKSEFSPKIKSEYGNGDHMDVDDPKDEYTREREANDRRRSRRSAGEEADGNSSDTRRANGLPNRAKVGDPFFVDLEGDPRRAAQAAAERAADREDRPRSRGERERGSDRDRDRDRLRGGDNYVPLGAVDSWRPGSDNNGRDRQDRSSRPGSSGDDRRRSGRDRSRSPRGGRYNRRDDRQRSPPPRRSGDRGYGDKGGRGGRGGPRNPEPTDDERDRRTVFVMQLSVHVRTKELHAFFTKAGEVVEAQIVKDRQNGRSKG